MEVYKIMKKYYLVVYDIRPDDVKSIFRNIITMPLAIKKLAKRYKYLFARKNMSSFITKA
jgi:hypothetical protein